MVRTHIFSETLIQGFLNLTLFSLLHLSFCAIANANAVIHYQPEIINTFPHDENAFTQGLLFSGNDLYESTGLYGKSSIRKIDIESGKIKKSYTLPHNLFGEGIAIVNNQLFQLTWKSEEILIYNLSPFSHHKTVSFKHASHMKKREGWGLTYDNHSLILSDGSDKLYFLNPSNLEETKVLNVIDHTNMPVKHLNELEYINGKIYANIWYTNTIVIINPDSGKIIGDIDLSQLTDGIKDEHHIPNGIAYDISKDRLFLTGKHWKNLYEVKLKKSHLD